MNECEYECTGLPERRVCGIQHENPKNQKRWEIRSAHLQVDIQAAHLSETKKIEDAWHATTPPHTEVSEWPSSEPRDEQREMLIQGNGLPCPNQERQTLFAGPRCLLRPVPLFPGLFPDIDAADVGDGWCWQP
jgi:hypothetical protein